MKTCPDFCITISSFLFLPNPLSIIAMVLDFLAANIGSIERSYTTQSMTLIRNKLFSRFPDSQSILLVFAVIAMVFYGWTTFSILWIFNSWLQNLTAGEMLSLISSLLVVSFLESLAILVLILTVCVLLPARVLKQRFVVRGSIASLCVLLSMILHLKLSESGFQSFLVQSPGLWWLATFILTVLLSWLLPSIRIVEKILHEFAERVVIFLYIFLPITAAGLFLVVLRILLFI